MPKTYRSRVLLSELETCVDLDAINAAVTAAQDTGYDVRFLIATVPDYVDSSSGWRADHVVGAIQSAMSENGYLLDRFRLIDWVRRDKDEKNDVMTASRLHEKEPGALIFRSRNKTTTEPVNVTNRLEVVLLVPETPTGGLHREAFRSAVALNALWNQLVKTRGPLRVIGPGFSGAIPSLALELKEISAPDSPAANSFSSFNVVSTATADENQEIFEKLAPAVNFSTTTRRSSDLITALVRTLGRLNPDWETGQHVALLYESNTAFGSSSALTTDKWRPQRTYPFPLHIAQLMADSQPSASPTVTLTPKSAVELTLRDTTPPSDQLPALRPQMTSPVVESEINGMLDAIQHEGITAVGIIATDERDVLFLARLLKRQAPNVQLFFTGSNLLYLHPSYLPYMRGALVGSTYPLSLPVQRMFLPPPSTNNQLPPDNRRRLFQSMVAEGVFDATQRQLGSRGLADYCDPATIGVSECTPAAWVSVIGDDGFWRIDWQVTELDAKKPAKVPAQVTAEGLGAVVPLPLPGPTRLFSVVLTAIVLAHVGLLVCVGRRLKTGKSLQGLRRYLFLRVLTPPITFDGAARRHALGIVMASAVMMMVTLWLTGNLLFASGIRHSTATPALWNLALVFTLGLGAIAAVPTGLVVVRQRRATDPPKINLHETPLPPVNDSSARVRQSQTAFGNRISRAVVVALLALMITALASFLVFLTTAFIAPIMGADQGKTRLIIALNRFASDSMVSPSPLIVSLGAALYAVIFAGLRRISLLGQGYAALAVGSPTFRLLTGGSAELSPNQEDSSGATPKANRAEPLARMLDMPAQNLPWRYAVCLFVLLVAILWTASWPHTIDGRAFSMFIVASSGVVLGSAFLLLAQAVETWRCLRPGLSALAQSPLANSLNMAGRSLQWNVSFTSPRLSDLEPLAALADRIYAGLMVLVTGRGKSRHDDPVHASAPATLGKRPEHATPSNWLRSNDGLASLRPTDLDGALEAARPRQCEELQRELTAGYVPVLHSACAFRLWRLCDQLVIVLSEVHWRRHDLSTQPPTDATGDKRNERSIDDDEGSATRPSSSGASAPPRLETWFGDCEGSSVALQCALVLRDILARLMHDCPPRCCV